MKTNLKITKFFKDNSSTILTIVGSVGVVITAVMAARDTVKAMRCISLVNNINTIDYYYLPGEPRTLTIKEKIKIAAPCYIPTVVSGLATILCIGGANYVNKNIQKSLTGAYVLLDQSYKEYRNSVKEIYGEDGNLSVINHIADKKMENVNLQKEDESDLFFNFLNLHFFESKISTIRDVERRANEILHTQGHISLRELCSMMGDDVVDPCGSDDMFGWSIAAGHLYGYDNIEIKLEQSIAKDGRVYYILDFMDGPTQDYLYL